MVYGCQGRFEMGLRRRNFDIKKYKPGDLIVTSVKNYPVVLREGPGYTFSYIRLLECNQLAMIVSSSLGHGSGEWVYILCRGTELGWVPASLVELKIN